MRPVVSPSCAGASAHRQRAGGRARHTLMHQMGELNLKMSGKLQDMYIKNAKEKKNKQTI